MVDPAHGFEMFGGVGAHVGMGFQGDDDAVLSGDVARPTQPLTGHLLAHAGMFRREEHVFDAHLLADGQLGGQFSDARFLPQVGLAVQDHRPEMMLGEPLFQRGDLIGRGNVQKDVVHSQRREVRPAVRLVGAVVHQPQSQGIFQPGRFSPVGGLCRARETDRTEQ